MKKIKEFFINFWKDNKWKVIITGIIFILLLICAMMYTRIQNLEHQLNISEQNIIAVNDSIKYERQKNGELQASIASYIAAEKELKNLNKDLYDKIKQQEGKVISLNNTIVQLVQDTTLLRRYLVEKETLLDSILQIDEGLYLARWGMTYSYDSTNFDIFTGSTYIKVTNMYPLELAHINSEITSRITQIDLTWGQKIEDGALRIFIQSGYPGFTVAQMEGVLIDPSTNPFFKDIMKPKRWFSGFSVGVGASAGFNLTTGKWGLVIGPSVQYNIYSW